MFVNNTSKKDIELRSFEGYEFTLPPGVSWLWDKAAEHLLGKVYKVETSMTKDNKDKYGFDNGHGIPALFESTVEAWDKGGKRLAQVKRFNVNARQIPRPKLITTAKQRGVSDSRIMEYLSDPNIDTSMIAEDINSLPVPDEVRYPAEMVGVPQMV